MDNHYLHFVGIDWATVEHEVHAMDAGGKRVSANSFKHSGDGLADLCAWLHKLGDPATIAVAIEVPHGALVETLLDRGFVVFSINPKQLDRFRDRFTVAGAKDDRRDAMVLADSLRTDGHLFRRLAARCSGKRLGHSVSETTPPYGLLQELLRSPGGAVRSSSS